MTSQDPARISSPNAPNDIVSGSLWRALWRLSLPMFVSALLQNLQSVIDLFWVGRLGSDAVAALAVSGAALMMLFPAVMGMATGTLAIVARRTGAGELAEASRTAAQSLNAALLFAVAAGAAGWYLAYPLCVLLGATPEVARLGSQYLQISFAGSLFVFLLFVSNSAMQAAGNSVAPMFAMVLSNLINLALDPVLIFGLLGFPRMGVAGAALATVIAEAVAAALVLYLLWRGTGGLRLRRPLFRWDGRLVWQILSLGLPSSGQLLARSLMSLLLVRIVAVCGTPALAAYGIGLRLHMMVLMPAFSLGNASATMIGQNMGAGQTRRAEAAGWLAAVAGIALMLASAAVLIGFAPACIRFFDAAAEVVTIGASYLRTVSPSYAFAALAIILGRALQGAGDTMTPMLLTVACLWGLQVPLAIFLARMTQPPTTGIWWAIAAAITVHGLVTALAYRLGRWKNRRV